MIDSHCHLADAAFGDDLPDVLLRAEEHGISAMVTIADSLKEAERCIAIVEGYDNVFCTVGVHPHNAKDWMQGDDKKLAMLVASSMKVRAIGEIGLDYHYNNSPREVQKSVFREQLTLAKALQLPAVIHCREAIADMQSILGEARVVKFVIHCCTEAWEDVQPLVEAGAYLGFTGIATYANAEEIRRTIRECPMERIMVETDAPYLSPMPHRGKRNEPAFVLEVAKVVAQAKGMTLQEVDAATTKNAVEFYGL